MSNWISSKLKVAETLLQQIDQRTAESLGKNEKPDQLNELNHQQSSSATKIEGSVTPLKDQFKKKSNDLYTNNSSTRKDENVIVPVAVAVSKPPVNSLPIGRTSLTDSDWTQLLGTPDKSKAKSKATSPVTNYRNGGMSSGKVPVSKKVLDLKKNQRSSGSFKGSGQKLDVKTGGNGNGKRSDSEGSGSGESVKGKSNVELSNVNGVTGEKEESGVVVTDVIPDLKVKSVSVKSDGVSEIKKDVVGVKESESDVPSRDSRGGSSSSDGTSASDSDSSSDSEKERERKAERARRRERIIAEKAAARAVEVIKEHENNVARLEGEKQSLEKILEERAKQQAQEASDLQTSMMETMDAVDLEKQKHNNTRMEVFTRLTKLETANADFAKSLATTQWHLQQESNQVAELKHQIELKEAIQEDLRRRITEIHRSRSSPNQFQPSIGVEFEREILEAEYSLTCDKITQLQAKEKKLKESIEILQKEIEVPTDVEVELKKRLAQLTNHLIQKQSQVEALSSEKATLMFRIETVTRLLEEEKSSPQFSDFGAGPSSTEDLEAGTWEMSKVKLRPILADNIKSGSRHLGSLLIQLDSIFSAGAAFIRRNPHAKYFAIFYLVCLHFWVSYILTADSGASDAGSGAVVSLENINITRGP